MTRVFVRLGFSLAVTIATFYFIYWLPFSLILPTDDFGWIRNLGSVAPAGALGVYVWFQTASPFKGLLKCVIIGAVLTGGIGFLAGFFGPMIFTPSANQGPLLGFVTGPLGVVVGSLGGVVYWFVRRRSRPR